MVPRLPCFSPFGGISHPQRQKNKPVSKLSAGFPSKLLMGNKLVSDAETS